MLNWGGLASSAESTAQVAKKQKRCILLWMNGGASQFETFDCKPGSRNGGPFRPISTNVPGAQVCELMPNMARIMDKLCVIRSMKTSEVDHPGGIYLMHTGYRPAANVRFPEIGAVAAKYLGRDEADLPSFVKISSNGDAGGGFLGPKYQPFHLNHDGNLPSFARSNMDKAKELDRHALREFVEDNFARDHKAETARMHREAYASARRLQNALRVFEFDEEWEAVRTQVRRQRLRPRLPDRPPAGGVGRAVCRSGPERLGHARRQLHGSQRPGSVHGAAWAALLSDLAERGLLDDTLVVWMGEIGRTPQINNRAGRDHYVRAWTTVLAGGGVKGGWCMAPPTRTAWM